MAYPVKSASCIGVLEKAKANAGTSKKCLKWYLAKALSSKRDPTAFIVRYAPHNLSSGQVHILARYRKSQAPKLHSIILSALSLGDSTKWGALQSLSAVQNCLYIVLRPVINPSFGFDIVDDSFGQVSFFL